MKIETHVLVGHPADQILKTAAEHGVDRMDVFLPTVDELVTEGLVTLDAVRIVRR